MYTYVQPSSIKRLRASPSTGRIEETYRHLVKGWWPATEQTVERVRTGIRDKTYHDDREQLISDIKGDLALCAYLFKNIKTLRDDATPIQNPLQTLREIRIEKLETFLLGACQAMSPHKFARTTHSQARRLKHSIITCTTAELVAKRIDINSDLAFSAALLTQVGESLVAWNYGQIYARACSSVRAFGGTIAERLEPVLGMAPSDLTARLARDWGFGEDIRQATTPVIGTDTGSRLSSALREVCEIAETLARTEDPALYPKSQEEWEALSIRAQNILGHGGGQSLRAEVWGALQKSVDLLPERIREMVSPNPGNDSRALGYNDKMFGANSYARRCREDLRVLFKQVYDTMREGEVSIEGLTVLLRDIAPLAGFTRGCVWRFLPDRNALIPLLRIGDRPLEAYENVTVDVLRPVAEAVYSTIPTKQKGAIFGPEEVLYASAAVGGFEHPGLIYLELKEGVESSDPLDPLLHFKAFRRCLGDCLQL